MILGTAGHVDHGKTSLVKALTGIDTDRLPEEKKRGITIELGFAYLTVGGQTVGLIDVPGHERFVKSMAAGAGGVDVVLLIIAIDEGVMPQTREHIDVCTLLGVQRGIIVLTKSDTLPALGPEWMDMLRADVDATVADTFLEKAPRCVVSAKTGEGLDQLREVIATELRACAQRTAEGPLFVPIDRAFTMKGFGCVVTGTVLSGQLSMADELSVSPTLPGPYRVRGLHVHGAPVTSVRAGQRVAINVASLEANEVHRGMAVTSAAHFAPAQSLDVELVALASAERALPRRMRRQLTMGTAQFEAVVQLLDLPELRPGERGFAHVRVGQPISAVVGQRFILRETSAVPTRGCTVAGGRVLAVNTPRRRRGASEKLSTLSTASADDQVHWFLTEAGYRGLSEAQLAPRVLSSAKELRKRTDTLSAKGRIVLVDREARRFVTADILNAIQSRAIRVVEQFHDEHPEHDGMSREALRQRLEVDELVFRRVLTALVESKRVEVVDELVRQPGRGRALTEAAAALMGSVQAVLEELKLAPPTSAELAMRFRVEPSKIDAALSVLERDGRVVRAGSLCFAASAIAACEAKMLEHFTSHAELSTQSFKELTGQSRKFTIPLAELFDARRVTLRVGDARVLHPRLKKAQ